MKENVEDLLNVIEHPESKELLEEIREEEIKHANIVTGMIKLID